MEEEVTKHTRKLYRAVRSPGHSFWGKLREVAIEIFIIVFAVTLSIWLHNWSDHRQEQRVTREFLAGIRIDLAKDIAQLEDSKKTFVEQQTTFRFIENINRTGAVDTMDTHNLANLFQFQMQTTHANVARYEGFKSSGKIGTIENDNLKQEILSYYQQTIPAMNDVEAVVNTFQKQLLDIELNKDETQPFRAFAKSIRARAFLQITLQNIGPAIRQYTDAEAQAKKIISMIDGILRDR